MKCNIIAGSVVNSSRQPILYSFFVDKPPGYKIICEHETIHYKTVLKFVLNCITFYLGDDKHKDVNFNGETLNFTLEQIKV